MSASRDCTHTIASSCRQGLVTGVRGSTTEGRRQFAQEFRFRLDWCCLPDDGDRAGTIEDQRRLE